MNRTTIGTCLMACSLCSCITHRSVPFNCAPFDHSVLDVVIPHINVVDATAEESVREVERLWRDQLAQQSPPETVFLRHAWPHPEYLDTPERTDLIPKVSFERTNITVRDCLQLVAQFAPLNGFEIRSGRLIFTYYRGHREDWYTEFVPVNDRGIEFFGLTPDTTAESLTNLLREYGIQFRDWMTASWHPELGNIIITTSFDEIHKLRALLSLIDSGYEIRRMPNQKMHGAP